jgi:hypothetical protein
LTATFVHNTGTVLSSAELFDPSSNVFNPVGDQMNSGRVGHTMTALKDGTVLIVGQNKEAEIYNYVR